MVTFDHTLLCKACVRWEQLLPGGAEQVFSFFVFSKPSIFTKINLYIISDRGFPVENCPKWICIKICQHSKRGCAGTRWCNACIPNSNFEIKTIAIGASFKDYWTFTQNIIPSESALKCACIPNWGWAGTRRCQAGRWLVCNLSSALHKRLSGCSMLQCVSVHSLQCSALLLSAAAYQHRA